MTDFPGVPGTATIEQLLARDDREDIKARERPAHRWCGAVDWVRWNPTMVVYVLAPPPRTITLPSGRKAKWTNPDSPFKYRVFSSDGQRSLCVNITNDDHDALVAWVEAWRTWEADNA